MTPTTCKPTAELAPLPLSLEINLAKVTNSKNETNESIFKVTLPKRMSSNSRDILEQLNDIFKRSYTINFDTDTTIITLEDDREGYSKFYKIDPAFMINVILSHALTVRSMVTIAVPIDGFCAHKLEDTKSGNLCTYSVGQANHLMGIGAFIPRNYYLIPFHNSKELMEVISCDMGTFRLIRSGDNIVQIVKISNERCVFTTECISFPTVMGQVTFNPKEDIKKSLNTLRAFDDDGLLLDFENLLLISLMR